MNKTLKKILATISAMAVCAVSAVSVSADALYIPINKKVSPETTSFSANVYGRNYKFQLWQEAINYFDNENIKVYISDKIINDYGKECIEYILSRYNSNSDYCEVGLFAFSSYRFNNEDDAKILEKYLSDNNITYETSATSGGLSENEVYVECYNETDGGEVIELYTFEEYFALLQKIKEDTGFIAGWISPTTMIEITEAETPLPDPTLTGDATEDGEVNIADAVLIMQALSNPNEYKLTPQGMANADMDGDGVTAMDALKIQEMILNW